MSKTTEGFFLAPIAGAFAGTTIMLFIDPGGSYTGSILGIVFFFTFVGSIFGWILGILIGYPLFRLFEKLGWRKLWQYSLGGIACAFPFWFAWFYPFNSGHWNAYKYSNSTVFFAAGIVSAIVFWVIRILPDQHSNKELQRTAESGR